MDPAADELGAPLQDGTQESVPLAMDEAELLALPLSASDAEAGSDENPDKPGIDVAEQQGITAEMPSKPALPLARDRVALPARPPLKRDKSAPLPTPQHLPPPAPPAPPVDSAAPTDSLSLMQLRRLVNEMPRLETTPYAFEYQDASSFPEEIEEWFSYAVEEQAMILKTHSTFYQEWLAFNKVASAGKAPADGRLDWSKSDDTQRQAFVGQMLSGLEHGDSRLKCLESLTYIVLGCWHETAGLTTSLEGLSDDDSKSAESNDYEYGTNYTNSSLQLEWIKRNVRDIIDGGGLQKIFDTLRFCCQRAWLVLLSPIHALL
jgi:hypothetical protein